MNSEFDRRIDRRGTASYKWDDNARLFGRAELLPFWVADMDFATPAPILEAIRQRSSHPVLGYGIRFDEYYEAIEDWLRERHHWTVPREWFKFCPPSSIVGIQGIISTLTNAGESIAVPTPTYGPLMNVVTMSGRRLIRCPMPETGGRYELDPGVIETRLEDDTRLLILCSPNNPTGRVFTRGELEALAALARRRDLTVISDEVHADLVMPGHRHLPYGSVGGERTVTVMSPNKTFNTAGLPQATLVIPDPELREKFQSFLDRVQLNHDSTFGAVGMIAGYTQCAAWLDRLIPYLAANHQYAAEYLDANVNGVRKTVAEATYLAWLDFRETGMDEGDIMARLVERGGVGLYAGTDFGPEGRGFFRMTLGCPRAQLARGLEGIARAFS